MRHCEGLPVVIFRPGIGKLNVFYCLLYQPAIPNLYCFFCGVQTVLPTYEEPVQGWIDNYYGPTSILTGVAAGILRILYGRLDAPAHLVPVDFCTNAILASTWKKATTLQKNQ